MKPTLDDALYYFAVSFSTLVIVLWVVAFILKCVMSLHLTN